MFRIDNETDAAEILELKRSNAEMMDMIRQIRSESAIGMVANVAIAADMAKAKAEQAVDEIAELRGKLKETINYLGKYNGHVNSRFSYISSHGYGRDPPTLPTI